MWTMALPFSVTKEGKGNLKVLSGRKTRIHGKLQANIKDFTKQNILVSGHCGHKVCSYVPTGPWTGGKSNVTIDTAHALLQNSKLHCGRGGSISITDPAQTLESDGAGFLPVHPGSNPGKKPKPKAPPKEEPTSPSQPPKRKETDPKKKVDLYNETINSFKVETTKRYQPTSTKTFCNIFVWDVTKAMGAEIPHWVNDQGERCKDGAVGAHEQNANLTAKWMRDYGKSNGWIEVNAAEAQAAANQGQITVVIWYSNYYKKNEQKVFDNEHPWNHDWDKPGHVAIVRPYDPSRKDGSGKEIKSKVGVYIAQAGSHNYNYQKVEMGFGDKKGHK
jgi:hypothetical protein